MLTGDAGYIAVLRRQLDNIYAQKKMVRGKMLLPQMYGDPRGYHQRGTPSRYQNTGNLFLDRLTEIYVSDDELEQLARLALPRHPRVPRPPGKARARVARKSAADLRAVAPVARYQRQEKSPRGALQSRPQPPRLRRAERLVVDCFLHIRTYT